MRWMIYFRLAKIRVPCWRLFEDHDEALAYAQTMAKEFAGFEYRIFRKL